MGHPVGVPPSGAPRPASDIDPPPAPRREAAAGPAGRAGVSCSSTRAASVSGVSPDSTGTRACPRIGRRPAPPSPHATEHPGLKLARLQRSGHGCGARDISGRSDGWMFSIRPCQRLTNPSVRTRMNPRKAEDVGGLRLQNPRQRRLEPRPVAAEGPMIGPPPWECPGAGLCKPPGNRRHSTPPGRAARRWSRRSCSRPAAACWTPPPENNLRIATPLAHARRPV